jgi:hypothetical protein
MRRREFCLGLVAMPALARSATAQEVSAITLIKQHGLPYLPLCRVHAQGRHGEAPAFRLEGPVHAGIARLAGGLRCFVMAGQSRPKDGVASLAYARPSTSCRIEDVDARQRRQVYAVCASWTACRA